MIWNDRGKKKNRVAMVALVLIFCFSCQEKLSAKEPRLILEAKYDLKPWALCDASLSVENTTEKPIMIVSVRLSTEGGASIVSSACFMSVPCQIDDQGIHVSGQYWTEEIGVLARMPRPSEWKWEGEQKMTSFMVLPCGVRKTWSGNFIARYEAGYSLEAVVEYFPLDENVDYYRCVRTETKPIESQKTHFMGGPYWAPSHRAQILYQRTQHAVMDGHEYVVSESPFAPQFFPYAMPAEKFDLLKMRKTLSGKAIRVERVPYDIERARTRCGVKQGPYTYFPPLSLWIIQGKGISHLVSKQEWAQVKGNAIPLADSLAQSSSQRVTLFSWSEEKDPGGIVSHFRQIGFQASFSMEKGGTYSGHVLVDPPRLVLFLKALDARGMKMDGPRAAIAQ